MLPWPKEIQKEQMVGQMNASDSCLRVLASLWLTAIHAPLLWMAGVFVPSRQVQQSGTVVLG